VLRRLEIIKNPMKGMLFLIRKLEKELIQKKRKFVCQLEEERLLFLL
jgi:hypothetical protein